jgi:hypothetical protein
VAHALLRAVFALLRTPSSPGSERSHACVRHEAVFITLGGALRKPAKNIN